MKFKSYDDLVKLIDQHEGVITCDMGALRDAHGVAKLGVNVIANISDELDKRGLGHFPTELPPYQHEKARIYKKAAPVGKLIKSVLNIEEKNDDILRKYAANDYEDVIKRIRELVCD